MTQHNAGECDKNRDAQDLAVITPLWELLLNMQERF